MSNVMNQLFQKHRMAVMGILNVTPDSFSDGGQFDTAKVAIEHALKMADAGIDVVDIGGESTRPGSTGIDADAELKRVIPVISEVKKSRPSLPISIDTSKTEVAKVALDAGATIVNDVTASAAPGMLELVAKVQSGLILMHMRGKPRTMQKDTHYEDVVEEVRTYLLSRANEAERAGLSRDLIALDPGIGFGKDLEGNLSLLRGLKRLAEPGYPLLVGTSRKSFLGLITNAPVTERIGATLASLVPTLELSRVIVRVHDAQEVVRFRTVLEALGLL